MADSGSENFYSASSPTQLQCVLLAMPMTTSATPNPLQQIALRGVEGAWIVFDAVEWHKDIVFRF